jgi:hypothetical protein
MPPSSPTDTDTDTTDDATESPFTEETIEDDEFDDDDLERDEPPADDAADDASGTRGRRIARRALSVVLATIAFEVLYVIGIGLITFLSEGAAALGPTLASVFGTPFAWAPAAVFLVVAVVFGLTLRSGRRSLIIGSLIGGVVVYLVGTLLILLAAGGWAAVPVFNQELGVYPFFITALVAREVLVWMKPFRR